MKQLHKPLANATDRIKISSKGSKFFIAVLIGGLATFFCSILLIQGIRKVKLVKVLTIAFLLHNYIIALLLTFVHQNKTTWMFPWIVESSISTFASFILFLVRQLQRSFIGMLSQTFLKVVSSCFKLFGETISRIIYQDVVSNFSQSCLKLSGYPDELKLCSGAGGKPNLVVSVQSILGNSHYSCYLSFVCIIIYHYLSLKVVLFFALSVYFILSVYSLYMILKIQKKSVTTFLDHEFQQGSKI